MGVGGQPVAQRGVSSCMQEGQLIFLVRKAPILTLLRLTRQAEAGLEHLAFPLSQVLGHGNQDHSVRVRCRDLDLDG